MLLNLILAHFMQYYNKLRFCKLTCCLLQQYVRSFYLFYIYEKIHTNTCSSVIVLIVVETNALIKKLISIQIIYRCKIREDFFIMKKLVTATTLTAGIGAAIVGLDHGNEANAAEQTTQVDQIST